LTENPVKMVVVRCLILCSKFAKNRLSAAGGAYSAPLKSPRWIMGDVRGKGRWKGRRGGKGEGRGKRGGEGSGKEGRKG